MLLVTYWHACMEGWTYGRTCVRTFDDAMAIKPRFLASMGYHIFLTMVLRALVPSARAELRYNNGLYLSAKSCSTGALIGDTIHLNKLKLSQLLVFKGKGKSKGLSKNLSDQSEDPHMGVEPYGLISGRRVLLTEQAET